MESFEGFTVPTPDKVRNSKLGNGSFGNAYALSDSVALKITSDPMEYRNASCLVGRKLRRVWDIYKVGKLTPEQADQWRNEHQNFWQGRELYYILGERLYPLGPKLKRNIAHSVRGFGWGYRGGAIATILEECNAELRQIGLGGHRDCHMGNMGQTPGGRGKGRPRVKFIDIR